jgi:hypothetical protein
MRTGRVLYEMITVSYQRGLRLPAELTLLAKALVHLDAVTRALDASFDPMETVRDYMRTVAEDRARRQVNSRQLFRIMTQSADLVSVLPHRIDAITSRLANNEFSASIEVPQVDQLLAGIQKVANRVFTGLALAGILVASGMLHRDRPLLGTSSRGRSRCTWWSPSCSRTGATGGASRAARRRRAPKRVHQAMALNLHRSTAHRRRPRDVAPTSHHRDSAP